MKTKHTLKLIDGDFTIAEAREVLINVFSSKIRFHQSKNFSSRERFGKDDETASTRLPELNKALDQIQKLLLLAEAENKTASINSEVIITLTKRDKDTKPEVTDKGTHAGSKTRIGSKKEKREKSK